MFLLDKRPKLKKGGEMFSSDFLNRFASGDKKSEANRIFSKDEFKMEEYGRSQSLSNGFFSLFGKKKVTTSIADSLVKYVLGEKINVKNQQEAKAFMGCFALNCDETKKLEEAWIKQYHAKQKTLPAVWNQNNSVIISSSRNYSKDLLAYAAEKWAVAIHPWYFASHVFKNCTKRDLYEACYAVLEGVRGGNHPNAESFNAAFNEALVADSTYVKEVNALAALLGACNNKNTHEFTMELLRGIYDSDSELWWYQPSVDKLRDFHSMAALAIIANAHLSTYYTVVKNSGFFNLFKKVEGSLVKSLIGGFITRLREEMSVGGGASEIAARINESSESLSLLDWMGEVDRLAKESLGNFKKGWSEFQTTRTTWGKLLEVEDVLSKADALYLNPRPMYECAGALVDLEYIIEDKELSGIKGFKDVLSKLDFLSVLPKFAVSYRDAVIFTTEYNHSIASSVEDMLRMSLFCSIDFVQDFYPAFAVSNGAIGQLNENLAVMNEAAGSIPYFFKF